MTQKRDRVSAMGDPLRSKFDDAGATDSASNDVSDNAQDTQDMGIPKRVSQIVKQKRTTKNLALIKDSVNLTR
jgi:hypothetical protein